MPYRGGFSSGAFARMCSTTKNTLIHYDELGILSPHRNSRNGYREYAPQDYQRFEIIRCLSDAGFSLREVASILGGTYIPAQDAIEERKREIAGRIGRLEREQAMLDEIGSQLREANAPSDPRPRLEKVPGRCCVIAAEGADSFDLPAWGKERIGHDRALLEALLEVSPQAFLSCYGAEAELLDDGTPQYLRMLYLLPEGTKAPPSYPSLVLEQGVCAVADYQGEGAGVAGAYRALHDWIESQGLACSGRWHEFCRFPALDHGPQSQLYCCRISVPVERASSAI